MPPGRSVDKLAAVTAKVPIQRRSCSYSAPSGLPSSSSRDRALPPKMSPAPVVSTGHTRIPGIRHWA